MKITDVKTFAAGNPPPHFGGNEFIFVKLNTDGGIEPAEHRLHGPG